MDFPKVVLKKFFVLEGLDGCGTTTQLRMIEGHNEKKIVATFEPTDECIGFFIRSYMKDLSIKLSPLTYAQLFTSDRREHLINQILPAIDGESVVVCDRYIMSTFAYQENIAPTLLWDFNVIDFDPSSFKRIKEGKDYTSTLGIEQIKKAIILPETLFYLDTPIDICKERMKKRGNNPDIFENDDTQKKVKTRYEELLKYWEFLGVNIIKIDGTKDPQTIHRQIWNIISTSLS